MCEPSNVPTLCAVWHLPGREPAGLWWLPWTPPQTDSRQKRKSSYALVHRSHSCRPLIFLIFWDFLVVSIPFLVYPPVSQKTEMSEQWRQRYLLAVTARFSQRWLSAYHKECRELVRWKIISFFSWNRDNHILIPLSFLNWPKHTMRERIKYIVSISIIWYISYICWEEKEGGRKGRGRETTNPFKDVLAYFRLQHLTEVHPPDRMFPSEPPPQCKNGINKINNLWHLGMKDWERRNWCPPSYWLPLKTSLSPCRAVTQESYSVANLPFCTN